MFTRNIKNMDGAVFFCHFFVFCVASVRLSRTAFRPVYFGLRFVVVACLRLVVPEGLVLLHSVGWGGRTPRFVVAVLGGGCGGVVVGRGRFVHVLHVARKETHRLW